MDAHEGGPDDPDETAGDALFREWLDGVESGRPVDAEALVRRAGAGAGADRLRARIERIQALHSVAADARKGPPCVELPGKLIGRYRVEAVLGEGGLSSVYLARDTELRRQVAIKILRRKSGTDDAQRQWMLNEARSLAHVHHRGVVEVYDTGEAEGVDYIVIERVEGQPLSDVLFELGVQKGLVQRAADDPPAPGTAALAERLFPTSARLDLAIEIVAALARCHDCGVLHRDVKPGNVIFTPDGRAKLIDFGLAHVDTNEESSIEITQQLVGTPSYLAPEQVDANQTGSDPLSDQWSVGVVLYELFTLRQPFKRDTRRATLDAVLRGRLPAPRSLEPTLPSDLELVLMHALEREPRRRYGSLHELAADLRAVREHRPVFAKPPALGYVLRLWLKRHRWEVFPAAAVVLAGLAGATFAWARSVRRALREIDGGIARVRSLTLAAPQEFEAAFDELDALRRRAETLDVRPFAGLAFDPRLAAVEHAALEWSGRLGQVLRSVVTDAEARGDRSTIGPVLRSWQRVSTLDSKLVPDSPHTAWFHALQRVDLPSDFRGEPRSYYWGLSSDRRRFELLQHHFAAQHDPGAYRIQERDAAGRLLREADYVVEEFDGPRVLELREPRPEFRARLVFVPAARVGVVGFDVADRDGDTGRDLELDVAGFWIMRDLVTWSDVERFESDRPGAVPRVAFEKLPADEPARLTRVEAEAFALWAGLRFPCCVERRSAALQHSTEPVPDLTPAIPGLAYRQQILQEWAAEPGWLGSDTSQAAELSAAARATAPDLPALGFSAPRSSIVTDTGIFSDSAGAVPPRGPAGFERQRMPIGLRLALSE